MKSYFPIYLIKSPLEKNNYICLGLSQGTQHTELLFGGNVLDQELRVLILVQV